MAAATPMRTLVALRYQLVWAQARTSAGRVAGLFVLYLLGALAFAFLALGGVGAGVAAVRSGEGETLVTGVLGALFATAIPGTLFLSVGPSRAFSDRVMRRYPLTERGRFLARHFLGLLDPLWLLLLGTALGLAAGLQLVGGCSLAIGLPAVLVYLVVIYLLVAVLVSLVGKVLETRIGPLLLMIAAMTVYLSLVFGAPLAAEHGVALLPLALRAREFTPAAGAAHLMMGAGWQARIGGAALLVAWALGGAMALKLVEPLRFAHRQDTSPSVTGASWYDALGDCFAPEVGPLVAKAMRYHLRCNRVRYSLAISAPIFVGIMFTQHLTPAARTFGLLLEMFIIGFIATFAISVNYFGWDGPGLRRYQLLPSGAEAALRANSYAGMMLGGVVTAAVLGFVLATSGLPRTWELLAFALASAIAGLLWLHSAGMWLSVLTPHMAGFDSMMSGNVSRAATILMVAIVVPLFVVVNVAVRRPQDLVAYWWAVALFALAGAAVFRLSLQAAARALDRRWERMVGDLAAKGGNFSAAG